ncbi:PEGA domain-containing protein [Alteromonas sediminis]|uniref:PEGA domain-containing protein n=1 Tax=Alteromonas sediminis TaxID=2259342 RepID=A0A3N5Y9W6_9ALTE|nr:SUMF1/EgtB/PvdO family nonheme iron enzyme [Alteromonas sediminis]RPJ68169.1 PEGA domain-containing protein [Alteromonas sediminis]
MTGLDRQLKARQKSGLGWLIAGGLGSACVLVAFVLWLFVVKGHSITVLPKEAADAGSFQVKAGLATMLGNSLYRIGTNVELLISSPEYSSQTVKIGTDSPSAVTVTLTPKPGRVRANIASLHDSNVSWFLDGAPLARSNPLDTFIPPGEYTLSADHPHYQPFSTALVVKRASQQSLDVSLKPVQGGIDVASVPSGARLYLNGQEVGTTPIQLSLEGGKYEVAVQLKGFETSQETLSINQLTPMQTRNYQLLPEQAKLSIRLEPEGGDLLINGVSGQPGTNSIDANRNHLVRYSKTGYTSFERQVNLAHKAEQALDIVLKKSVGEVSINANVPALIEVNGVAQGESPLQLTLQTLPHTLRISRPGYRAQSIKVTPNAQKMQNLDIKLLTEFDARRQEGQALFADVLGIRTRLVKPDAFTMGSPQNEAGRLRHEHPVNVDFDYRLWVGVTEVTEAQFAAYDANRPISNLPVTNVDWIDAAKYCNWLSEKEALTPVYAIQANRVVEVNYNADGYRLPTEAEWEWLAKKSRRATETQFVWGSSERIPEKAGNFADQSVKGQQLFFFDTINDGFAGRSPVGSFKPDRLGLYDLAGNVSEWVQDFYTTAPPDLDKVHLNYTGPARGQQFVVKGSNFNSGRLKALRSAMRIVGEGPADNIGFRVVRKARGTE